MALTITYNGFSTLNSYKKFSLTDYDLAKQDLINYFSIRKGSKLMNPNFGSIIWEQLFEPLNETTQSIITTDIQKIVSYDPRLKIIQVSVTQESYGIQIQITLTYIPTNQTETLVMNFNKESMTMTTAV
jgi:phage baseplate assembly protein W